MTKRKLQKRFNEHLSSSRHLVKGAEKGCKVLSRSIRKHGEDRFTIHLLEDLGNVTKEDANNAEIFWIFQMNTLAPNGMNLTTGGQLGQYITPEQKQLLSEKAKQRFIDRPELRELSRQHALVVLNSPEVRKKSYEGLLLLLNDPVRNASMKLSQSKAQTGRKHSPEMVEKRAASLRGTTHDTHYRKYPDDPPLPKYVTIRRDVERDGTIKLGITVTPPKLPKKNFTSSKLTMEEKIQKAVDYLNSESPL